MSVARAANNPKHGRVSVAVRLAAGLAAATAAVTALPLGAPAAAAPPRAQRAAAVSVQVVDVDPAAPVRSSTPKPLTITLRLRNTSSQMVRGLRIDAQRGQPIATQRALNAALADRTPPTDGLAIGSARRPGINLAPGEQVDDFQFRTTTSIQDDGSGLCLCNDLVYPLYLNLVGRDTSGEVTKLGSATTYISSVVNPIPRVRVAWVWPLIERPHRLDSDSVFTDDDLAASISGGPLDRSLAVVEQVDPEIPLTLLVDPELLDELAVMATGRYTVRALGSTRGARGTGQLVAQQWLARFATVLSDRPQVSVSLTPYADPDVQALTRAGLGWSAGMPSAMARRVTTTLAGREPAGDVAVPVGGGASAATISTLAKGGASSVVLDAAQVSPRTVDSIPVSVGHLPKAADGLDVALTSPAIQDRVQDALGADDDGGSAALPVLTAELAVRAIQNDGDGASSARSSDEDAPRALLMPPRHIDPTDVGLAKRMIEDTSRSTYSTPVSLTSYLAAAGSRQVALRKPSTRGALSGEILTRVDGTVSRLPALKSLFAQSSGGRTLLTRLPAAVQRASSGAWRSGTEPYGPSTGVAYSDRLLSRVDGYLTGVRIVRPSSASGGYALGSSNSDLPITIDNRLNYTVVIRVSVEARNGLRGFNAKSVTTRIGANSKQLVRVPVVVQRSGRIPVAASLTTSSGAGLGESVNLFVESTLFGAIGLGITVGAGVVLVAALLYRYSKRVKRLRSKQSAAAAAPADAGAGA